MAEDIEGLEETIKNLNKLFISSPHILAKALTNRANVVLKESIEDCPVDTGTLRRSGKVNNIQVTPLEVSADVRFDTKYAVHVHENLKARHPKGHAKFLENAANKETPHLVVNIAKELQKGLKL